MRVEAWGLSDGSLETPCGAPDPLWAGMDAPDDILTSMSVHASGAAPSARTIALMNQKGGVGKTTTAVNLAAALAEADRRVCLIDLDPQAHLTLHLGLDACALEFGTDCPSGTIVHVVCFFF